MDIEKFFIVNLHNSKNQTPGNQCVRLYGPFLFFTRMDLYKESNTPCESNFPYKGIPFLKFTFNRSVIAI